MSDITITNGLPADAPWTLANTDTSKLDQTNLINLAVGQLALLGASQGQTLQIQTGKLKELVGSVDKVNAQLDFLSNVSLTPSIWSGNPSLGIPDEAVGWKVPSTGPLTSTDEILVDKMIAAYDYVFNNQTVIRGDYNGATAFKYIISQNGVDKNYVTKTVMSGLVFTTDTPTLQNIQFFDPSLVGKIENGQIIKLTTPTGTSLYSYMSGNLIKSSVDFAINFDKENEAFFIPQSTTQLQSWNIGSDGDPLRPGVSSAEIASGNSALLENSTIELAPNILPQTDPPTIPAPTNAIKMSIDIGTEFDMARYEINPNLAPIGITYLYAAYPPKKVDKIDSSLFISENVGKVMQVGNDAPVYFYADSYGYVKKSEISKTTPFIYNPTNDQIISWKGQYAEKIIVITQRSSDQQLFVNNLAQKYQYAFDAATYVLKAFTTMLSSAANNI